MKVEPGNILKLFLNFSNFEPQYSYRLYSYKKKSVVYSCARNNLFAKIKEKIVMAVNSPQVNKERTFHVHLLVESFCIAFHK